MDRAFRRRYLRGTAFGVIGELRSAAGVGQGLLAAQVVVSYGYGLGCVVVLGLDSAQGVVGQGGDLAFEVDLVRQAAEDVVVLRLGLAHRELAADPASQCVVGESGGRRSATAEQRPYGKGWLSMNAMAVERH